MIRKTSKPGIFKLYLTPAKPVSKREEEVKPRAIHMFQPTLSGIVRYIHQ
ncbi:MAG: hypothetical protein ACI9BD_000486 [Candidatus Marinamargulisbacteria bacterium]|jgi:hypothetical protein